MAQIIEVGFKGNRREFFLWEQDEPPALKCGIVVETDRGEDLGYVHATGASAELRNRGTPHGYGGAMPTRVARRIASADDVRREKELRVQDDDARRRSIERVVANDLVMKVSDAEWQWDRKKLTLYFTAERRVDFRTLVRELAAMFRARIELKQIGVRDEAKRLDGIGRCGRQYCSASWLPELRPVNLGVAKDQRLSLNPSQISGACGRLMCCLRYEHEFYVTSRRRFPKEGRIIRTARGEEKVIANDIFRERVVLRGSSDEGELRTVPLEELRLELEAAGSPLPVVATPVSREPVEEESEADVEDEIAVAVAEVITEEPATDEQPDESADEGAPAGTTDREPAGADRRPHRRRGRRGGRKNRPGEKDASASERDTPPKEN